MARLEGFFSKNSDTCRFSVPAIILELRPMFNLFLFQTFINVFLNVTM